VVDKILLPTWSGSVVVLSLVRHVVRGQMHLGRERFQLEELPRRVHPLFQRLVRVLSDVELDKVIVVRGMSLGQINNGKIGESGEFGDDLNALGNVLV